jgi:hypothetical protein
VHSIRVRTLLSEAQVLRNDCAPDIMKAFVQAPPVVQSNLRRHSVKTHRSLTVQRFRQSLLDAVSWQRCAGWNGKVLKPGASLANKMAAEIAVTALQWRHAA